MLEVIELKGKPATTADGLRFRLDCIWEIRVLLDRQTNHWISENWQPKFIDDESNFECIADKNWCEDYEMTDPYFVSHNL